MTWKKEWAQHFSCQTASKVELFQSSLFVSPNLETKAENRKEAIKNMVEALNFIQHQAGVVPHKGPTLEDARIDEINVNDVMSRVRLIHKGIEKRTKKAIMSSDTNKATFM